MFEFAWPYVLAALPLPLLALLLPRARQNSVTVLRAPFFAGLQALLDQGRTRPSSARLGLACLIWVMLLTAAARPQWVGEAIRLPVTGRDLLLAVDISRSMEEQDMILAGQQVDRLRAVQSVAGDFIRRREGDRLGLILFGTRAYTQAPLSFDRATVRGLLFEAETRLAGNATAIGDAIGLAIKRLRDRPQENRVLILLTDGANTAGEIDPLKAAELAAREGVRIYTIGVGADEMMVRDFFGMRRYNPSADLDEDTLTKIAEQTGGRYFRARDIEGLEQIYLTLDKLEPLAEDEQTFRPIEELYPWPLALALGLSVFAAAAVPGVLRSGARSEQAVYVREPR